jgi:hypothetical protein
MPNARELLRLAAKYALRKRGYEVTEAPRVPGVAPAARLIAAKGEKTFTVAVRTSQTREIGLVALEDGGWKTASAVQIILVAVPTKSTSRVEVLCFKSSILTAEFDAHVEKHSPAPESDVPVFIPLDPVFSKRSGSTKPGLAKLASWREEFQVDELRKVSKTKQIDEFIERVTRDFADLIGVDTKRVVIDFRISSSTTYREENETERNSNEEYWSRCDHRKQSAD